jgi:hypothetical protein
MGYKAVVIKHPPKRDDYDNKVFARTRSTSSTTTIASTRDHVAKYPQEGRGIGDKVFA